MENPNPGGGKPSPGTTPPATPSRPAQPSPPATPVRQPNPKTVNPNRRGHAAKRVQPSMGGKRIGAGSLGGVRGGKVTPASKGGKRRP